MIKRIIGLAVLLIFGILSSSFAYAANQISIDSVFVNGRNLAETKSNFLADSNNLNVLVILSGINFLGTANVQAILTDLSTGSTVADSKHASVFPGRENGVNLNLQLIDSLKRQKDFRLTIKVFDSGRVIKEKSFGIRFTDGARSGTGRTLEVSLDRVKANNKILAASRANFVDESNTFEIVVDFTALENLENAHVEAVLKDLNSGFVVADATPNFNLPDDSSTSKLLKLELIDKLKQSPSFELAIKVIDSEGRVLQKVYGVRMRDGNVVNSATASPLDVSVDRVKINNNVVVSAKKNFINETDEFAVLVDFTTLENLKDAHVEASIRDLNSGFAVSDASPNFQMQKDSSNSRLLILKLLNDLKKSNSFDLAIKVADAEGNFVQKNFELAMEDGRLGLGAKSLDVSIDSVEVEGKVVADNENNFLVIGENKKEIDVKVRLTALENIEKARLEAVLAFENGDVVADNTVNFDMNDEESSVKKLELPLIGKFEQNNFKLKLRIVDAEGNSQEKTYVLKISKKKFPFIISSVALSPESNAEAGKNLVARLRFKNSGVMPLEGITAKVSISELGVSATKFVDQIRNSNGQEVREDFVLKLLDDVQTGTYTVRAEIFSQFGGSDKEVKEIQVFALGKEQQPQQIVNDKLTIKIPVLKQKIKNDGVEVIYPITLENEGPDANAYTVLLDGASWADLRLSESNTFVLKPKESKTLNVYASTTSKTKGDKSFLVTIKSNDKVLEQIAFTANIVPVKKEFVAINVKKIFEIFLIVLAAALVVAGFAFGVRKLIEGSSKEEQAKAVISPEVETYY